MNEFLQLIGGIAIIVAAAFLITIVIQIIKDLVEKAKYRYIIKHRF